MKTHKATAAAILLANLSMPAFASMGAPEFLPSRANSFVGDLLNLPPTDDYMTKTTKRFELIYPKALEHLSEDTLTYLEESHEILAPHFVPKDLEPGRRTVVILVDNQDLANGLSSALGHQGMVLFTIAPEPYTSIGEYDHWLRNLVLHEYTHYLTLSPTSGVFKFLRFVFGDLILPNGLWPTWLTEGLAVYAETRFTRLGRGNGAYYRTITRDGIAHGILEKNFLQFDEIMGPVPDFPFGESHYYAGFGIVSELVRKLGDNSPRALTTEGSGRVTYFLNGTLENIGGKNWRELWSQYVANEEKRLKPEIAALKNTSAPQTLTDEGASAQGARLSPDGKKLAYIYRSGSDLPSLRIRDMDSGKIKVLDRMNMLPWLAWSNDSKTLYFSKIDFKGPFHTEGDIHQLGDDGSVDRLTYGERVKDPAVCGNDLVFTSMREGWSSVYRLNAQKKGEPLYRAPLHHRVSTPRCDENGRFVYFSEHGTGPREAILRLDRQTNKVEHLLGGTTSNFGATFPEPTRDGLYFTRVANGYYELAYLPQGEATYRVIARSTGGYWMPSVAGKQMAVTYLSSRGFQAALLDKSRLPSQRGIEPLATTADPSAKYGKDSQSDPEILAEVRKEAVSAEPSNYNLLKSLLPRLWAPWLLISQNRNQFGLGIVGWDDLDQLRYTVIGYYDTVREGPLGSAVVNHRLPGGFRISLGAQADLTSYSTSSIGDSYNEERTVGITLSRPFPAVFHQITPFMTGEWSSVRFGGDFGGFNYKPEWRYGLGMTYDSRQRLNYSISADSGSAGYIEAKRFQQLGNFKEGSIKYIASWTQLIGMWPEHSNLSLKGTVAVAPNPKSFLPVSYVEVGGNGRPSDLDPGLRGYPVGAIRGDLALVSEVEYRIPLAQVFHGWDTFPLFFRNNGLFVFGDFAKIRRVSGNFAPWAVGAGGGMIFNTQLGYLLPLNIRLEFAHGFSASRGGENQFTIGLQI